MKRSRMPIIGRNYPQLRGMIYFFIVILIIGIIYEMRTSRLQARFFSRYTESFAYPVVNGESEAIRFPQYGPYNIRLGYARIPQLIERMKEKGFFVYEQACWSKDLLNYSDWGFFPPYPEKMQAGVLILDSSGRQIIQSAYPRWIYPEFAAIPPVVVRMLLFIENRKLLNPTFAYRNPAIEWQRIGKAFYDVGLNLIDKKHDVAGGSTLATQIEKFRHSKDGITTGAEEKMRQIVSATVRAYRMGEKTDNAKRQIVLSYLNSIPLSAVAEFGEVCGLGEGLWAWYGMEFNKVNSNLIDAYRKDLSDDRLSEIGHDLRAVLSLFISQRRPSMYLIARRDSLRALTDQYLRLMMDADILPRPLGRAAFAARLEFRKEPLPAAPKNIVQSKVANLIRSRLLGDSQMNRMYDLERLDLTVKSTIDNDLHRSITEKLFALRDPLVAQKAGLKEHRLLAKGDPAKVVYSMSLYEHTAQGNLLRVQTNNFDGPFNIDEQMKLDLGSSAKLRTVAHYLEIIAELHTRFINLPVSELKHIAQDASLDPLTRWSADYLSDNPPAGLADMLHSAMDRVYSANPKEHFFTGGGLHAFGNFNRDDDFKAMTVRAAFQDSVNLVFIRMMRDIVYYHMVQHYKVTPATLSQLDDAEKRRLLTLFADYEGKSFIQRFWKKYSGKTAKQIMELFFTGAHLTPERLAAIFRYFEPEAPVEALTGLLNELLPGAKPSETYIQKNYDRFDPSNFSLVEVSYTARVHPLELWVVKYLLGNPAASLATVLNASVKERQEVYYWLFENWNSQKHHRRIQTILELEAFSHIHRAWKRLGYPFEFLVPSYASAIGSSADRPGALAELVGIILNNGKRSPLIRIQDLHFAKGTPYETVLKRSPSIDEQVMEPQVAQELQQALMSVAADGTAARLRNAMKLSDNRIISIGGKTGTGDHRYKTFGPGGKLIESKVMNRDAVFAFFIGDRYFGSINAFVAGAAAAEYRFTSALPVQVLKFLLPDLIPFIEAHGVETMLYEPVVEKASVRASSSEKQSTENAADIKKSVEEQPEKGDATEGLPDEEMPTGAPLPQEQPDEGSSIEKTPVDQSRSDETPPEDEPDGEPSTEDITIDEPPLDKPPTEAPPVDNQSFDEPALDEQSR